MSLKPPITGSANEKDAADLPLEDSSNQDNLDGTAGSWPTRPTRATGSTRPHLARPNDPTAQAINDAQAGLSSLLNPQGSLDGQSPGQDDTEPQIISPSGALRNQTHGRIAGPTASLTSKPHNIDSLAGYLASGSSSEAPSSRAISIDAFEDSGEIRAVPQSRIDVTVARGKEQIEVIRQRTSLLIGPEDRANGTIVEESAAMQSSRRAASRWVTRYATHIVILLVVGLMVAIGGLAGLTKGNSIGVSSDDAALGTDHMEGDQAANKGIADPDSQTYDLTLPRTELNSGNSSQNPADGSQPTTAPAIPPKTTVTKYTVAKGDTIQSVAKAFNVLPETIMGSNGIYDASQDLTPGDTLSILPVDGMYYVPTAGDTLEGIAHRFGVDPEVISAYAPNNLAGGVKPGQSMVIPGGMMPERNVTLIYTVAPGDTLRDIAARFGVDVPTMINSNDIPNPDSLQIGAELRVLPVEGVEYKVTKGDTLRSIADRTGVSLQTIIDYAPNALSPDSVLQIDQVLLVPGGSPARQPEVAVAARPQTQSSTGSSVKKTTTSSGITSGGSKTTTSASVQKVKPKVEVQAKTQTVSKPATVTSGSKTQSSVKPVAKTVSSNTKKVGTGNLMWPVQGRITQLFSSHHNGLDIAISAGTPIHAADSGRVIWSGWRTDGLGNCVMIDHMNGLLTIYGHMIRQPSVYVGQYVSKGDIIGNIGSTGHSTGPHVHFMVKVGAGRNYRNPLAYLSGR